MIIEKGAEDTPAIETKYNVGDTVGIIGGDRICQKTITSIAVEVRQYNDFEITYNMFYSKDCLADFSRAEEDVFPTKEALINSLLES